MYNALKAALEATGIPLAEGDWDRAPQSGNYMILRLEDEASAVWGDQHKQEQSFQGSVHLYARSSDRTDFNAVQRVLDQQEVSWRFNGTQYEPRNGLVHYEWLFELEQLNTPEVIV